MAEPIDIIYVVLDVNTNLPVSAYVIEGNAEVDYPDSAIFAVPLEDTVLFLEEEIDE
jgi:hypothetical protein